MTFYKGFVRDALCFGAFFTFLIFGLPWIYYIITGQPLDFGGIHE